MPFVFEDLIQFDISAKRKVKRTGREIRADRKRCWCTVPIFQGEGRVCQRLLTKDLIPEMFMKQVFEIADYFRIKRNVQFPEQERRINVL